MSTTELAYIAIAFFLGAFALWVWDKLKASDTFALRGVLMAINKLTPPPLTPEQVAKAAADAAHKAAMRQAIKDAADKL